FVAVAVRSSQKFGSPLFAEPLGETLSRLARPAAFTPLLAARLTIADVPACFLCAVFLNLFRVLIDPRCCHAFPLLKSPRAYRRSPDRRQAYAAKFARNRRKSRQPLADCRPVLTKFSGRSDGATLPLLKPYHTIFRSPAACSRRPSGSACHALARVQL